MEEKQKTDLEKAVADLGLMLASKKDQIAFAEQEYLRFKKLTGENLYVFEQQEKRKSELDNSIKDLEDRYNTLLGSKSNLEQSTQEQSVSLSVLNDEIKSISLAHENMKNEMSVKQKSLSALENELINKQSLLGISISQHEKEKEIFNKKVTDLKDLISKF